MKAHGHWHSKVSRPPVATPDATPGCKIGNTTESHTALYTALDHAAYLAGVLPTGAAQKDYTGLFGFPLGATVAFSTDGQTLMTADERAPMNHNGFTPMTLWNRATRHIDFRFDVIAQGPDLAWMVEAAPLSGKELVVDVAMGTGFTAFALTTLRAGDRGH